MDQRMDLKVSIAIKTYNEIKELIYELGSEVKRVLPDFNIDTALSQYDLILQSILISAAAADGNYISLENEFIKTIVDSGDIIDTFNSRMKEIDLSMPTLSWNDLKETINAFDEPAKATLLATFSAIAHESSEPFISTLAPFDDCSDNGCSYLSRLVEKTSIIVRVFSKIHDETTSDVDSASESELSIGLALIDSLIKERWERVRNEFNYLHESHSEE